MTRTALITGATGGIGRAFVAALHERGYELIVTGRSTEKLTELSQRLTNGSAQIVAADLATRDGIDTIADVLESNPVDLLVNNAGFGTHTTFADADIDRELSEATVNMLAVMALSHAALQGMTRRGRGAIINIASVAGFQPLPHMATYSASKAFVDRFSLALAAEARAAGVLVTSINPGPVDTAFFDVSGAHAIKLGKPLDPDRLVAHALKAVDRQRARTVAPGSFRALEALARVLPAAFAARGARLVTGRK